MNRISATLSIWSEKLQPEQISEILHFEPDRKVGKGADRVPPRPRPTAFGWHVTCVKNNSTLGGEVLELLVSRVAPGLSNIPDLRSKDPAVDVCFFLHVAPKLTDISLYINQDCIKCIYLAGGSLDIEFFDL